MAVKDCLPGGTHRVVSSLRKTQSVSQTQTTSDTACESEITPNKQTNKQNISKIKKMKNDNFFDEKESKIYIAITLPYPNYPFSQYQYEFTFKATVTANQQSIISVYSFDFCTISI